MEEYKQRLKRQNVLLWIGIVLLVVLDVLVGIFWDSLGFLDTRLMTESRLKNLWQYEEEARWQKDERRILIGEKAAKLAADAALAGLVVAAFVVSLYNMDAFNALYYTLVGFVLLRFGCWLYVRRKY